MDRHKAYSRLHPLMSVLVTGVAAVIGSYLARALLARGES
jgi:hypothetical protein